MSTGDESARPLRALAVGPDARLEEELRDALAATTDTRVSIQWCAEYSEADRSARGRCPDLVCIQLDSNAEALQAFVASLRALNPGLPVVGVRQPHADFSGSSDVLVEAVRAGFVDVIDRPLSSTDLRRLLPRITEAALAQQDAGHVIAFHSTKGVV